MKNVAVKLGVGAEASEDAMLAAVTKLLNRVAALEGEVTPLRNRRTELETENQTLLGEQVEALLDAHKVGEERIRNRLKPVLNGLKSREDRLAALADFGFKPGEPAKASPARVLNRGNAAGLAGKPGEAAADPEEARVEKIRNRAADLQKGGLKFDAAWAKAVAEASA